MKRALALLCVIGLALAGVLVHFALTPLVLPAHLTTVHIASNSSLPSIAQQLQAQGVLQDTWRFRLLARLFNKGSVLQAGDYVFNKRITPYQLLRSLEKGWATQSSITFIEGHTFMQMRARLAHHPALKHTLNDLSETAILQALGAPYPAADGLFFPDTYYFYRDTSDLALLARGYTHMQHRLRAAWQMRANNLPYKTPYEALIMASIIEKETARPEERPMIAAVFVNRLRLGMRLQTDPTVIYGMGAAYRGNISKHDLLHDTPYNTYTRNGLPPTPIAMPGLAAIQAALHPATSSALYFVSKGNGQHFFSHTLAEHNRAVAQFQLKDGKNAR